MLLRTGPWLMTLTELDDVTSSPLVSVAVIKQLTTSFGATVVGVSVRDVLLPSVVFCVSFVHVYARDTEPPSGSDANPEQVRVVSVTIPVEGVM